MTERAPKNPEEELPPIYEQCPNCDQEYAHAEDNTKLFLFDKQPECNYVACRCPECRDTAIYLIDLSWAASVIKRGVPVKAEDYASDDVYDMWLRYKGIELPKTHELTPRHEKIIGSFATTLANCPDELLYGFITDDNKDLPYPQRWA